MNESAVRRRLRSFVGARKKVQLTRGFPGEPRHNGFIVGVGRTLVMLHQFHDFSPEGYAVLRLKDITGIRSGRYERQFERMLAAEGILDRIGIQYDVLLDDMTVLLESLQKRGENVIVQCQTGACDEDDFYIGQILSVGTDSLCFDHFDALGRWDRTPHSIPLEKITQVEFETPYVRTFSKYVKAPRRRTKGRP